jgi:hypothetical protein
MTEQQQIEELRALLKRISEWDMMDVAADGPFWRREIQRVLDHSIDASQMIARIKPMPSRCPDCGWSLPRFDCPHQGCNGVALHKRSDGTSAKTDPAELRGVAGLQGGLPE